MLQAQLFSLFSVLTGTFSQQWSMTVPPVVDSTIGDVVLPCSFTHPSNKTTPKTSQFSGSPDNSMIRPSSNARDLAVTDNGVYFCRVELDYYWGNRKWQTASGTQLNIMAKAQILSLFWVEASLGPGNGSLRCVVEGNPPSTITWFTSSEGNIDPGVSTIGTQPFQWTSSIPYFPQEVYTCKAENSLGRAERRFPPGPTALTIALSVCGVLLLLLLLGVALFYLRKRESRQSLYKNDSPEDGDMALNLVYANIQLNTTQPPRRSSRVPIPDEDVHYAIVKLG